MAIRLGTTPINAKYLGSMPQNKIMLGMIEIFPNIGSAPAWTPEDLYLNGEQGGWYNFSDLVTLSQDSGGSVPVTAAGQPIGLALGRRTAGPESPLTQFVNGNFETFTGTGMGPYSYTDTGFGSCGSDSIPTLAVGEVFKVVFEITALVGELRVFIGTALGATGQSNQVLFTTTGVKTAYLRTISAGGSRSLSFSSGAGSGTFTVLSFERVLGDPLTQPTAASRPLLQTANGTLAAVNDAVDDWMTSAQSPEWTDEWEMWVAVQFETGAGIFTGVFSKVSAPTAAATSSNVQGVFQRSDGVTREMAASNRVGGGAADVISTQNSFVVGGPPVTTRATKATAPDVLRIESNGSSNSMPLGAAGVPATNAFTLFTANSGARMSIFAALAINRNLTPAEAGQLKAYFDELIGITP